MTTAAVMVRERAVDVDLTDAGGSGDDDAEMIVDPAVGRELPHDGLFETANGAGFEALDRGVRDV